MKECGNDGSIDIKFLLQEFILSLHSPNDK